MDLVWQSVDAAVRGGAWEDTVFFLTYDDWGGYDDHVATPIAEYTADNVQLAFGPRVPLIMFGAKISPGIDSRWCSHASLTKTVLQLLGLPALRVPRVDHDAGLVDRVDPTLDVPPPPPHGETIAVPPAPLPTPPPAPLPPPPSSAPIPVPHVFLLGGRLLPPPHDVKLPQQPAPPA
jgi:hypothetical protein